MEASGAELHRLLRGSGDTSGCPEDLRGCCQGAEDASLSLGMIPVSLCSLALYPSVLSLLGEESVERTADRIDRAKTRDV